jgi:hypothetical protein
VRLSIRWLSRAVAIAVAVVIVYSIVAVEVPQPKQPAPSMPPPPSGRYTIYVANWGHHTSIIVPQPVAWHIGPANDPDAPFVEYAWGDRSYFMATLPGLWQGLRALFLTGRSTTYVASWRVPPDPAEWRGLALHVRSVDASQLRSLVDVLQQSLDRSRALPAVQGYAGRFYGGVRRYSWWYDCNRWIVARLGRVGLARNPLGVVFAVQVARHLQGFSAVP